MMETRILLLNPSGTPNKWIKPERAAALIVSNRISWTKGDDILMFSSAYNIDTDKNVSVSIPEIISISSKSNCLEQTQNSKISNKLLFRRDFFKCCYCGSTYDSTRLNREHIIPVSKGGPNTWDNVITSCRKCNLKKGDQLLEDIGWKLLYQPFIPNYVDILCLRNPSATETQIEYLKNFTSDNFKFYKLDKEE